MCSTAIMAEAMEEASLPGPEEAGLKRTAKDLFGGAVGGAVQVLVGMSKSNTSFTAI